MKKIAGLFIVYFVSNTLGHATPAPTTTTTTTRRTCANVTRISLAVNLLDKECLKRAANAADFKDEGMEANDVETTEVEMDMYADCLLKKSSVMNEDGKVNKYFDIVKIMQNLYKKTDEKGLGLAFVIKSLQKCRVLTGTDHFTTAANIMKCLLDNQETILWCNQN